MIVRQVTDWLEGSRIFVVAFGTHAGLGALLLGWETYVTDRGRFLLPGVWPVVFAFAWVACVMYHRHPGSRRWWKMSAQALLAAYGSRSSIFVITGFYDGWTARIGFGAITWAVFCVAVWGLWLRLLIPHHEIARVGA